MSRRKFDDIPTIPMFDLPEQTRSVEKQKRSTVKSVDWGTCPSCTKGRVGLVRQGEHVVWRLHWVTTWSGATRQCTASGTALCDTPARAITGEATPSCKCKSAA